MALCAKIRKEKGDIENHPSATWYILNYIYTVYMCDHVMCSV